MVICPKCGGRGHWTIPMEKLAGKCKVCDGLGRLIQRTKIKYFRLPKSISPHEYGYVPIGEDVKIPKVYNNGEYAA
jgi:DnaJ-class molecular chaperone